jgi:uncharacterized protein (TIGR03067 family)
MRRLLPGVLVVSFLVAAEVADPSKKDLEQLQGDWACESMEIGGQKFADDDARAYFRTIKGDTYAVNRFTKVAGKGTIKLDATKNPRTIDSTPDGGKVPPVAGIYKLEGDTLTLCTAPPGKPRPTKFDTADTENTMSAWTREKKK